GARILPPRPLPASNGEERFLMAVSNEGRMLVFPLEQLPEMAKGKGNKIIAIPSARVQSGEEYLVDAVSFGINDEVVLHAGKRHLKLRFADLDHYRGERGRRGHKLPRGLQRVDQIEVLPAIAEDLSPSQEPDTHE
ncbi:MAG: DNA topoisomerase IV subunit A, partial [Halomonadaceae bacterium]